MPVEFPQRQVPALQQVAARLLDSRKPNTDLERLARDMLGGFHDVCTYAGLDRVLDEVGAAFGIEDVANRSTLADHAGAGAAVVKALQTINLDGGGPRNAKPTQVTDSLIAGLELVPIDESDRSIAISDQARADVTAAIAGVVNVELAVPTARDWIVANARTRLDERFHMPFTKLVVQLDDRGLQITKLPKIPIDALHASQSALAEAREALIERVASLALDRAKAVLERTNPDAAARIDQPVTLRATTREVAIRRACDPRVIKTAAHIVPNLVDSLAELGRFAWRAPEKEAQPYSASKTFSVGDVIAHPKFGRGTVVACPANRIEVEFPEGKFVLVHVPTRK